MHPTTETTKGVVLVLLMIALGGAQSVFSQSQVNFRQLSVKEGLSQNSAISITQDSTGYLWIATQDGLNRYDGKKFKVYPYRFVDITKRDYSHLGKVYNDRQGGLWIIPMDKIPRKFDPLGDKFEILPHIDNASVIYQGQDDNLWIGTYSKGLYVLRPDAARPEKVLPFSEVGGTIYNIAQNSDAVVTLATDGHLVVYSPESEEALRIVPKTRHDTAEINFSDIVYDAAGRQWIGTFGDGLYFRIKNDDSFYRISELPFTDPLTQDLNILDLHIDSKKRLWVATYGRGLYMIDFEKNSIAHFGAEKHNPKALHYNDILCIYEDYTGTLWFGTDGAGASYYDEYLEKLNSLTNYETPENINIDVVRSITVDKHGIVWIGTSGKGLTRYEPATNSWLTYNAASGNRNTISSDRVMSLWADADNDLWIGTQGGGLDLLLADGKFLHYSIDTDVPLRAQTIWCIYKDDADRIWLGTREQGLILFDKEKGKIDRFVHHPDQGNSLPSNNIRVITSDAKGNLWIGTETDGVAHFDVGKRTFKTYNRKDGDSLSSDRIKSLYHGPNGILWIGTNGGGLDAFDIKNKRFRTYTVDQGLANNVIYSILPDATGNLWLSSNKGITKFAPGATFAGDPQITNYTNYAGLATEFNTGASYKDPDGTLYFGGLDGFYWFRPDEIKENTMPPKTTITGFSVLDAPRSLSRRPELDHDQNTVSFTFSSMQYSLPEKNRYRYKLDNYDEDWVEAGNVNLARYTQLPPDDYRFQVRSSNYDGVWSENSATYSFSIAPPWYATAAAKFVYVLLLLATILMVYMYLKWRWRMQLDLRLKEDETRRLQQLHDMKSKLYTDISHEFRTPLTLISGPIDAKLGEDGLTDTEVSNFSMIKRNTDRLIALVDQLLHLAKLERGKLKLKMMEGDLGLFLGMLASSFEYRASQKNMDYDIQIDPFGRAYYDGDALEKIVTNLLSNAFKYGRNGGTCRFEALKKSGKLQIRIRNTVEEPSQIDVEKLFARFYQKDEHAEGAGVGLSLVKELVQLYRGEIGVRMEADDTIFFHVELPLEISMPQTNNPKASTDEMVQEWPEREFAAPNGASKSSNKPFNDTNRYPEAASTEAHYIESNVDEVFPHAISVNADSNELPLILIVEDHSEVRSFLKSVWAERYGILEAANGAEGIEKALETVPDLIISDVRMPEADGIELCRTLKSDGRTSHIPIILLTAGTDEEQEIQGLRSGADDFVVKPFKINVLQTRVENLIRARKALRDRYSQEVVLKSKDLAITPTDEKLLNRLQKVLDENLNDSGFSAKSFSHKMGMSRMQLHRKLQVYTGLSTTEFIRSQRLKQALHILKTSDSSVSEVAYTVGFNTPSYFIKCFKETYKKTPADYL
ncbi:two-component regulator propeller domain-containing protein [Pricia sp. S334]|uniref:histidine kinase n=1 Tax=Pricia mediterranea TaxID=3076079 RepID=A0ABU3L5S9_9FLAO|nr:two-component regulator propeller domain-containing protein [Pricia sp. S334]MDT7829090.1 two-component regulator propeller domain-containing protein [Pricia sp. S334]